MGGNRLALSSTARTWAVVEADEYLIEDRGSTPWPRMIEYRDDSPGLAFTVSAEACDGAHGIQGPCLEMRFTCDTGVAQAFAHRAVYSGKRHR